jgi:poly(hydroxyalkanoate) depolymerase family esterase
MSSLAETIVRLSAQRRQMSQSATVKNDRLVTLTGFGSNPGALVARTFVPDGLPAGAPLVVVLHGCTQTAAGYDGAADWSGLAAALGFAVLFAEQIPANNPNRCFNWFVPGDIARRGGEAESIAQMTTAMIAAHRIDPARVFVTGLSAGGAMTAVMLATYPELFAGGAVIAGLPYGVAASMPAAFEAMRGGRTGDAAFVRKASSSAGPWPTLSIWHGDADQTVHVSNATALAEQWRDLHGSGVEPDMTHSRGRVTTRSWHDAEGRVVIEEHIVAGMGHGTPLAADGAAGGGRSAPFMLDVGISSTRVIAQSWGLGAVKVAPAEAIPGVPAVAGLPALRRPTTRLYPEHMPPPHPHGVQQVIEDALRAAGLMR